MKRIIFGAIDTYKSVTKYFMEKYDIAYIVDNDKEKQGKEFYGTIICPVEELKKEDKEVHILVAVRSAQKEITEQLEALGFEKNKNFFFFYETYEKNTYFDYLYWRNVKVENGKYLPTCLHVELSGICNLQCAYCAFHGFLNRKEGHRKLITWEIWREIVKQAKEINSLEMINACGAGEIFMHPEWFELLQYIAKETKIPKLVLYSNGMLLTKENSEKINQLNFKEIRLDISISGKTEAENDLFRKGSSYNVIKENLGNAFRIFDPEKIHVVIANNYVIDKELFMREKEGIPEMIEPAEFIQRDFPELDKCGYATYISPNDDFVFPESTCFEFAKVFRKYGTCCTALFTTIAVDCEGNYLECSSVETSLKYRGNVLDKQMMEIFQSDEKLNADRKRRLDFRDPEFCLHCNASVNGFYIPVRKTEEAYF